MEDTRIIDEVLSMMRTEDLWFTQKTDPTIGEAPDYFKLDEYGDLTEGSIKKIIKEIKSLIGDGAVDEIDAINLWLQDAMVDNKVAYKDILVTKFKDKPVVDGIEAYKNPVQLGESKSLKIENKVFNALNELNASNFVELKDEVERLYDEKIIDDDQYDKFVDIVNEEENKCEDYLRRRSKVTNTDWKDELGIESDYVVSALQMLIAEVDDLKENKEVKTEDAEYDEYMENERKRAEQVKQEVYADITPEIKKTFDEMKTILDEENADTYIDGWYYPERAVAIVNGGSLDYHLNPYMNLTVTNILNMINENETVEDAIDELFTEYKVDSAYSWADNFISVLKSLDTSMQRTTSTCYVFIDEDGEYDYEDTIENDEEAIKYAKENGYVKVELETYYYDYNGDDMTYGEPDTEVIWEAEGLEENFKRSIKDKKEENAKRRLKEENNKSANLISQMMQEKGFDAESNAGKIVLRTSALFNALSEKGYDVQVAFDNGESTNAVLLGEQGGQVIVTITDAQQPLKSFASGNFEVNDDNLAIMNNIADIVKTI